MSVVYIYVYFRGVGTNVAVVKGLVCVATIMVPVTVMLVVMVMPVRMIPVIVVPVVRSPWTPVGRVITPVPG